jgi:hypothetical protein
VDLLPNAADAATGKHRRCDVARYVNRHSRESASATQPRHRLRTARLDQGNALRQDVISHDFALSHSAAAQIEDADTRVAILEFATEVDGRQVERIDKLTFDEDGRIRELKVMLRPASALQAVGARMAEEFARLSVPS